MRVTECPEIVNESEICTELVQDLRESLTARWLPLTRLANYEQLSTLSHNSVGLSSR